MSLLITIYIVFFLALGVYVGINIFHLIRFRIGFRGDQTNLAIGIYLALVITLITLSWLGGFIAFQALDQL